MSRVAIIDLGTNTFHLLVADVNSTGIHIVHKEKKSVKIGENGISLGIIAQPAQERAIHTLQGFKQKIEKLGVDQVYATATSAFRNAANGQELAARILEATGIKIDIINGEKEAYLIYQGVKQALNLGTQNCLIMDIGGGSVEFIIGDHDQVKWKHSFEIGAQRLMDKFHHTDPIAVEEIERLMHYLDEELAPLSSAMELYAPKLLVGASGTFDTLSLIYCTIEGLATSGLPQQPLTIDGFKEIFQDIIAKNRAERMAIPGMIEMRVDMIVVASCLIEYVLNRYSLDSIAVSSYALKEGALHEITKSIIDPEG